MRLALLFALVVLGAVPLRALPLPPTVKDAVTLEVQGRLSEALDRYRAALTSEASLVQDEALAQPLTVWVFAKAAHLSIDVGQGDEAFDLSGRLLASRNPAAVEAGTIIRARLARLQGQWVEAQKWIDSLPKAGLTVQVENWRLRLSQRRPSPALEASLKAQGGPASWVLSGKADVLASPTDVWPLAVQDAVRLQVGAFREWSNALTLIDMLREKGWSPLTDVKTDARGDKWHTVYLLSRQPESDRARLDAQGLSVP